MRRAVGGGTFINVNFKAEEIYVDKMSKPDNILIDIKRVDNLFKQTLEDKQPIE